MSMTKAGELRYLVAADWSRVPSKRVAYVADIGKRSVKHLDLPTPNFDRLLACADEMSQNGATLLSMDLALGIPSPMMNQIHRVPRWKHCQDFLTWLATLGDEEAFWAETKKVAKWSAERPFIAVPPGKGSLTAFRTAAGHDLLRRVDRMCRAKSPLIVSGIPGSVGSGTRSFWQELIPHLGNQRAWRIWPFDGTLEKLLRRGTVVLAENYPAISYTVVFAQDFPSPHFRLAKTKQPARELVLERLGNLPWVKRHQIDLPNLQSSRQSEDHFDALMAALAQMRCVLDGISLADEPMADEVAEGGILLSHLIDFTAKSQDLRKVLA